jgi:hypothetical protein
LRSAEARPTAVNAIGVRPHRPTDGAYEVERPSPPSNRSARSPSADSLSRAASARRIRATIRQSPRLPISRRITTKHCTPEESWAALWASLLDRLTPTFVGAPRPDRGT